MIAIAQLLICRDYRTICNYRTCCSLMVALFRLVIAVDQCHFGAIKQSVVVMLLLTTDKS